MSNSQFVHLHVHSQYSMLDGAIRIKQLAKWAKEQGAPAIALSDHGNMFGAMQFNKACKSEGVAPILGCEIDFVDAVNQSQGPGQHLLLLARSQKGYQNLVNLVSRAWINGSEDKPRAIDYELLHAHREGLVGLSACMGGFLAQSILQKGSGNGKLVMGQLGECFEPGAFFVELQDHGFVEQKPLNRILCELAKSLDFPIVATNDCHYPEKKDHRAKLILQCIASGMTLKDSEASYHKNEELYLKSAEEMLERFAEKTEAIKNTLLIAEMCGGAVDPLSPPVMPNFPVPQGMDDNTYFRKLANEGLESRFAEFNETGRAVDHEAYRKRLAHECDVIVSMGFASYFLIVADFINHAKQKGIPVGPGRGSGAGSIVAYAMGITGLDPIEYGLLFERFLNPERVSMPDFDIDFCMDRRDEVIDYVKEKYGKESVGQIATFHALKSRSVVRDVARVMGMTPQDAGRIATLIPEPIQGKSVSIPEALEKEPRLRRACAEDAVINELIQSAQTLEDLTRHAGMHAAGVVISEGPLWSHVPVFVPEPGVLVTQYDKDDVEAAGLVKFDFLGLRTLTVIDIACRLIQRRPGQNSEFFRIDRIPLDDPATFALLRSGETTNVFQLESSGMQALFKQLMPDSLEDVIAAVALYRPGPLGSGMVEDFVQRKHGRVAIQYPHPSLEPILKETYGVLVYQEQVMQVARSMAGYSLGAADLLRRAMGKKKAEEMAKQKATFVQGATDKGYQPQDAEKVFELMSYFAGYGFNKSHSAAYAMLTYQTAYLKANFPVEFLCATLTADKEKSEKVVRTIAEAKSMGITVLPPDVNESEIDFTVVYNDAPDESCKVVKGKQRSRRGKLYDPYRPRLRFGLGAVKGIGVAALDSILSARRNEETKQTQPFLDLFDFAGRVDSRKVNKGVVEALVQCGAFGSAHQPQGISRAQAFAAIDMALERGKKAQAERRSGQTNLLALLGDDTQPDTVLRSEFPRIDGWSDKERLAREKHTLGFYVSGHPLDRFVSELKRFCSASTQSLSALSDGTEVTVGGMVEGFRERTTKTGHKIAFFDLEDPVGRVEVIVRPRVLDNVREILGSGEGVLVKGSVQHEHDRGAAAESGGAEQGTQAKLVLKEATALGEAFREQSRGVRISLDVDQTEPGVLKALREALEAHPGKCPVRFELNSQEQWAVRLSGDGLRVDPSEAMLNRVQGLLRGGGCELV
ncbi:MAG: DNA polymerase III subunit alpha [Myxococcales bacterium]|nr:MAG: DNA polymerase III subunit alpha [Myxococcales bacterium]